ncbi:F-box protein CPR1-like [Arachis duranensis]|uniref:F-box protein CPR1-like n=1 Tax=Arachis duranensis TaxID=130453 RepID=A0A6P5NLG2_ARADU|nr:F-box protein CPR1-like [Arachis duranensis]
MEEKKNQNDKSKSIHDILPLDLIHIILLRVPIRHLACLRCVSKLWCSLISDPDFVELHFHHSPVSTNACITIGKRWMAYSVYLDALFSDGNDALQVREVSPPLYTTEPCDFIVLGSCRGFVLFGRDPNLLVVWNPLTGSGKLISYSHIYSRCKYCTGYCNFHLYGFGYDAWQDDYLVVVAWQDMYNHDHFDCFSMRTNSWIDFDAALPKPLFSFGSQSIGSCQSFGWFLNGAIHWVKERTFSRISGPEQLVMSAWSHPKLALLGGCLALYYCNYDSRNTHIWVMKEYKVHSSWTLYQIPHEGFRPLCLSSNGDIIGKAHDFPQTGFYMYNLREERLQCFKNPCFSVHLFAFEPVYTESLLPLPSESQRG